MGSSALVDTNLLIDFLSGVSLAQSELARYTDLAISVISRIELLAGEQGASLHRAERFLTMFKQIELTPTITERAILVRRNTRLKLPDAVLLATAEVEGRTLLTRNTKDFKSGPAVRFPYVL